MSNSYCSGDERSLCLPIKLLFIYWTIVIVLVMSDRSVWQLLFIYWTIVMALVIGDRFL
ncbi:MAG: hypothetical protein F6K39_20885 [Okeania sp. SIO3B3]|nr:hypothetical protein [Okeania sp. SIO3B3]